MGFGSINGWIMEFWRKYGFGSFSWSLF